MMKAWMLAAVVVLTAGGTAFADLVTWSSQSYNNPGGGFLSGGDAVGNGMVTDGAYSMNGTNVAGPPASVDLELTATGVVPASGPMGEMPIVIIASPDTTSNGDITVTWIRYFISGNTANFVEFSTFVEGNALVGGGDRFTPTGAGVIGGTGINLANYDAITIRFNLAADGNVIRIDRIANPEPGTIALFGAGILGLGGFAWRRRKTLAAKKS